ncbi:hypothetical protein SCHPADRAFT_904184 [Schizopora paradoxa]|uniref:Uncharacterized protein n=1 Tax=Schizopora paradoxa TaxID=27342 RepID=A0A0H2S9E9_9AGAM|nr:hypothetical protein SCHPADRAFT_904184 [Schizopora paradoxa]
MTIASVVGDSKSVSPLARNFILRSPSSKAISTSSQVDAVLSKELKLAVKSVAPRVVAALRSCHAVESIVEQVEGSRYSDNEQPLLEDWRRIIEDFRIVLRNSRQAAIAGATQAQEISGHILPYLFDKGVSLEDKKKEIRTFLESVEKGRGAAGEYSMTLEKIVDRISVFKARWTGRVGRVAQEITERISELEEEIHELAETIKQVKKQISKSKSSQAAKRFAEEKSKQSALQVEKKDALKDKDDQLKSAKNVSCHTTRINVETDGLIIVWNLIADDVSNIMNYFDLLNQGDSKNLFEARLEKLPGQYRELEIALRKYASALSHRLEPGYKPEKKGILKFLLW